MKKRSNSRQGLSSDAQKWLRGEKCGFYQFKHNDELEALWLEYGDTEKMFWRRGAALPITLEDLAGLEDEWLASADNDEYGGNSYFIGKHYTDAEKQALWAKRGDKSLYRWSQGMWKPESLAS